MNTLQIIGLVLSLNYICLVTFAYYMTVQKLQFSKLLSDSKNPRKRQELLAKLDNESKLLNAVCWPYTVIKDIINASKQKK